jgi:Transposase IS66 family
MRKSPRISVNLVSVQWVGGHNPGVSNPGVWSDRWSAYAHLPLARRQLCWTHLRRDFKTHTEGLGAEKELGERGLELYERVFWAWEVFTHTHDRAQLKRTVHLLQRQYKPIIRSYAAKRARNKRCRGMARNLFKTWPALWTFAKHNGVQPTNNHAERALRSAVIYRKLSFGSPVTGRRDAHRQTALGAHDLPTTVALPVRLPHRRDDRPRPRPASPATRLSDNPLNAYIIWGNLLLTITPFGKGTKEFKLVVEREGEKQRMTRYENNEGREVEAEGVRARVDGGNERSAGEESKENSLNTEKETEIVG